ncbi:LuxR C-terminal-related transcriptional regulator [Streptomyces sp. NPDC050433]|uniref:LuxR C-terminal-related transcriptional regulator n=1 Tax=Streptomyces sp. NPDC050433 TaxID=3365615 RepID=UPI0037A41465
MTTTIVRVILAPRERQVVEGLADGSTLADVARNLKIQEGTATGYLQLAKRKLHGVSDNAAALAVAYATQAITRPELLDTRAIDLPREQRDLVPLIARGMTATQMVPELKQSVDIIRRHGRELQKSLRATNRAHVVTRAWQYQVLTADRVIACLS